MENRFSLDTLTRWMSVCILAVIPVFFLPVTQDFYDTNKLALLTFTAFLVLILTGIKSIVYRGHVTVAIAPESVAFVGLAIASLASLIVTSGSRVDALMSPLGLTAMLSLATVVSPLARPSHLLKMRLTQVIIVSGVITGLITLYQFVGMGRVMFPDVPFLQNPLWTPTGTTTTTITLLLVSIGLILPELRTTHSKPDRENAFAFSIASLLILSAGLIVTCVRFFPTIPTSVMPISVAWGVMLHSIQSIKSFLFGAGVENFVSAYTTGKPVSLMATGLWNIRFGVSANMFFHMMTVYGVIGLGAALWLVWQFKKGLTSPIVIASALYVTSLLFVPPTITTLALGAALLVLSDAGKAPQSKPLPLWASRVTAVILILLGSGGLYLLSRVYQGELVYYNALRAAQNNEGTPAYTMVNSAIGANPYVARYHISASQIHLSIANSVAAELTKPDATKKSTENDQQKQLVSQLIEQAISEAKIAVTLNSKSIVAWENLGATYQALIPVAQGADTWAVASYQKAITIDPTNPVLAVNLGGVLVHQGKYEDAILWFQQAIRLKPDYANAYYNAANAYKLKGDTILATEMFTKTLSLVSAGSSDYARVTNELEALKGNTAQRELIPEEPSGDSLLTLPL